MRLSNLFRSSRVGEFGILFVSLLAMFILPELLPDEGTFRWQMPLLFSIVMLSALATVSNRRGEFWFAVILMLAGAVPEWLQAFGVENVERWGKALTSLFLIYVSVLILRTVLTATQVDAEVILGALCVYLLAALIWGGAYYLVEVRTPGSFAIPEALLEGAANPDQALTSVLHYFSFVTVTTLGYGDIQPVAPLARSLAVTEALFGQIYLVTLIARLVSMATSRRKDAIQPPAEG